MRIAVMGFLAFFARRLIHEIKKTMEQHQQEEDSTGTT
jgi:hypothetical protein